MAYQILPSSCLKRSRDLLDGVCVFILPAAVTEVICFRENRQNVPVSATSQKLRGSASLGEARAARLSHSLLSLSLPPSLCIYIFDFVVCLMSQKRDVSILTTVIFIWNGRYSHYVFIFYISTSNNIRTAPSWQLYSFLIKDISCFIQEFKWSYQSLEWHPFGIIVSLECQPQEF